jgi:ABC-type glycerol-3-phosphate transport system permease component
MKLKKISKRIAKLIVIYCALVIIGGFCTLPILWMLSSGFKYQEDVFTLEPTLIPKRPTLENYKFVLKETPFGRWYLNSLFIAACTTVASITVTSLGAYGLSRFRFRGSTGVSIWILSSQMLPGVLLVVPLFLVFYKIGLLNTRPALIIAYTTFTIPFCTWMLKGYFDSIPKELEQAAMIDGCSRFGAFIRILIPSALPGIAAVALFAFLRGWNELLMATVLLKSDKLTTLSVGMTRDMGASQQYLWGPIMAQSTMIIVVPLAIFIYVQRYLIAGLTAGAVKG